MQVFGMPPVSRVVARGFLIILLKGKIIRNVFLKTKTVQGNVSGVLEITLEEIFLRYRYIVPSVRSNEWVLSLFNLRSL